MSDVLTPLQTVTFTVAKVPTVESKRKTIQRLMRLQPEVRKGLKMLQERRARTDNDPRRRAGRIWVHRAKATRLTTVEKGETFTLKLTPQIIPDVKSVMAYLEAKPA